ncbi:MAG: HAMP domain-containing protein [Alphaproteobacteria bacterium]|nr:HAMP domain-containing protein [Alphaproteobacteria bacterium]
MITSLGLRIVLIAALAMFFVQLLASTYIVVHRSADTRSGFRAPLPDQLAATVELLEIAPEKELPRLLRAMNTATTRVALLEAAPPESPEWVEAPFMRRALSAYIDATQGRRIEARVNWSILDQFEKALDDPSTAFDFWPVRFIVELSDGRFAVIDTNIDLLSRILGMRFAPGVIAVTTLITILAVLLIRREIRPIDKLTRHVRAIASGHKFEPLREEGSGDAKSLIAAFNALQKRVAILLEGRTQLLAGVAHDFGTYLTRLRLRAEHMTDETQRTKAIADITEMRTILDDTITLAALDRDRWDDTATNLTDIVLSAAERIHSPQIAIDLPDRIEVRSVPAQLTRAVTNLVKNAVMHAGAAEVRSEIAEDFVDLIVEDRGPGIPEAERDLALQPFYRVDKSRGRDTGGTGLGLAIANQIAALSGGSLTLEGREGGGLRARLRLRLHTPSAA